MELPGGSSQSVWVYVCSRTLQALCLLPQPLPVFTARCYEALLYWCWSPGPHGLAWGWDRLLPRCPSQFYPSHVNVGPPIALAALPPPHCIFSAPVPISTPPTCLYEYGSFKSLVVGLPYSLIFWQFWVIFVLRLVVILLMVVQGGEACLPMPPSWPEVSKPIGYSYRISWLSGWILQLWGQLSVWEKC